MNKLVRGTLSVNHLPDFQPSARIMKRAIHQTIPFGAQYLRGLTPLREDWARDMATMRELGFNTLRAWLVWGALEPRRGEVDVAHIIEFLDLAQRHDLRVGLLFHLHGCPEWATQAYPHYWYVDERGRGFEPAPRANTPSGGWPGLCYDHPEVQRIEEGFITTVVRGVGDHPALAFWEPVNEPHQWIDFAQSPPGVYCYCNATRAAFVRWLQAKYGTLEALNEAWGRRMGDWAEVRPPTWRFGLTDWCDWRTFTAENVAAMVARRAAVIRTCSDAPVVAHAWGGSCVTCTELGSMAFDDWKNAEPTDIWGDSAFPRQASSTVLVGLGTAATRAAAAGRPFWQAELGVADYHGAMIRTGRLPAQWLEMWSWESIRQGAKGLLYWQFRKERHGNESGAYGLTDYGGQPTDNARAVARIGRCFNENAELFAAAQPLPAKVAILFSYQSYMMVWSQLRSCRVNVDAMSGYYHMFWERNIPVDIVHEERVTAETLAQYQLVVLPMPVTLAHASRVALREYVERGGHVLSDPYLCAYDVNKMLATEVPGDGLAEVFGCREHDIRTVEGSPVTLQWAGRSICVEKSYFQATWDLIGAEVVAAYDDGTPAITRHRWGQGAAMLSGLNLGMGVAPQEGLGDDVHRSGAAVAHEGIGDLVAELAQAAGVTAPLATPKGVVASLLRTKAGPSILIAMNTTAESVQGIVRIADGVFRTGRDLLDPAAAAQPWGTPLRWEPHGTRVLALE